MVFSVFDPIKGNPHEVERLQEETGNMNSGLSPDGKILAITKSGENRIRLLSLSGQPTRKLVLKNWNTFSSVDWTADSKGRFVTSNPTSWRSSLLTWIWPTMRMKFGRLGALHQPGESHRETESMWPFQRPRRVATCGWRKVFSDI